MGQKVPNVKCWLHMSETKITQSQSEPQPLNKSMHTSARITTRLPDSDLLKGLVWAAHLLAAFPFQSGVLAYSLDVLLPKQRKLKVCVAEVSIWEWKHGKKSQRYICKALCHGHLYLSAMQKQLLIPL